MAFTLTEAQSAVVKNRGGGLLVSAAAGAGKTRVLVERLLDRVLSEGRDMDEFLIITFTNAAAAELRSRIVEELSARIALAPKDKHLRRQATLVYKAPISTIHAFCANLLREYGHSLDLDPDFRLCDEGEAGVLRLRALDAVMDARYEDMEPEGDFARLVDTMSAGRDDSRLMQIVLDTFGRIQSHANPDKWLGEQESRFRCAGLTDAGETDWGALLLADAARQVRHWVARMETALTRAMEDETLEKAYAPSLAVTLDGLTDLLRACDRAGDSAGEAGWDAAAAAALAVEFPRLSPVRDCDDGAGQEAIKATRAACKARLSKLAELLEGESETLLADLRDVAPAIRGLTALVRDFGAEYRREKNRRNILDFNDLEQFSAALLVAGDGTPTPTAHMIAQRYCEIMVDEYQDTNAVQNAIFHAISKENQNLFMVGDVKQSIYRFRLADPGIFLEKYRCFTPYTQAAEGEARKIVLSRNFRSRPRVLAAVNDLFSALMSVEFGEMEYGPEEWLHAGAAYPQGGDVPVSLAALDISELEDAGEGKTDKSLIEARYVARQMRKLLDEEAPIADGAGGTRPVQAGDMVVLLRSPGPVLHHYVRALNEAGIPWYADGGEDFFERIEISVALSFLQILDNPRQEVPLIAVLRSPVYGFSGDKLAKIRANAGENDFFSALELYGDGETTEFLSQLNELRFGAVDKRAHQIIWDIYASTNLLGIFGAMEGGEERRANLLALYELARHFEAGGHKGLFGFLAHLTRLRESGAPLGAHKNVGVQSVDAVRILSIHRSKGLEYPVVFLCGLARRLNREDMQRPILLHAGLGLGPKGVDTERLLEYPTLARRAVARALEYEMMAEELRLLYVAMTRARERLCMTCTLTGGGGELRKLWDALPATPQTLAAAQSVGHWVLLHALGRPEASALRAAAEVSEAEVSEAEVSAAEVSEVETLPDESGWEIALIDGREYEETLYARKGFEAEEALPESGAAAELAGVLGWQYPYMAAADTPSKLTATQLKGRALDGEVAEGAAEGDAHEDAEVPEAGAAGGALRPMRRPRFAREEFGLTPAERGTALHLVMQYMDFERTKSLQDISGEIDRLVEKAFLTPEQGAAVQPEKLWSFFASPVGRALRAAPTLMREFKFSLLVPAAEYYAGLEGEEQVLLQGVVDCWYDTPEGLVVLDFKTDRVTGEGLMRRAAAYRPQLSAYSRALTAVTGRRVAKRLLWFFAADCAVEV